MRIEFSKMHGLGNDFVVLDLVTQRMSLSAELIAFLADRHFGIGCDQLLVVEPPSRPDVDFRYRIFNADGSEVEQCGNGARCFARFVIERKLTFKRNISVETSAGVIQLAIDDYGWVTVNMGMPKFTPADIPFKHDIKIGDFLYALPVEGEQIHFAVANMGNPHAVIKVDDVMTAEVERIGKAIESHAAFPERVNVGFMQVVSDTHIKLRVYERGVGETKACGTGACAAVVSGIRQGLLKENTQIRAQLYGGSLGISWQPQQPVFMVGSTETVYQGMFFLEQILRQAGLRND